MKKPTIKPLPPVKITEECRVTAAWALQELSQFFVLGDDRVAEAINATVKCRRNLSELSALLQPVAKFTAKEAELSRAIHTYLRKGSDSMLSVVLYRMIDESRGQLVWHAFVKSLWANKRDPIAAVHDAKSVGAADTDSLIMGFCLEQLCAPGEWEACLEFLQD